MNVYKSDGQLKYSRAACECEVLTIVRHGGSGAYRGPLPPTNQGLKLQLFELLKAEVFLHEIVLAAKIIEDWGLQVTEVGSPKYWPLVFCKLSEICFTKKICFYHLFLVHN